MGVIRLNYNSVIPAKAGIHPRHLRIINPVIVQTAARRREIPVLIERQYVVGIGPLLQP